MAFDYVKKEKWIYKNGERFAALINCPGKHVRISRKNRKITRIDVAQLVLKLES